ncbi:peritrophin-1-like [Lucilia cuprina]|uniref:peritrophin-1-like n=1 Tax=Lucilia cuprina TaxID=7375 RepID=UPI001F06B361|nr:peritrophin-1-like [Lucilia cuprina]
MKFNTLYVFATFCLCLLATMQCSQADIVCPAEQPDDSLVVQFPSPTSCSEFYKCNRGEAVLIKCPEGLDYNARLQVCDYPYRANCQLEIVA